MSTDALVLLREDHKRIRGLFKDFTAAANRPPSRRERIVTRILEELTAHTFVENEVVYPRIRALLPDLEQEILESFEEHHVADVVAAELAGLHADDERFEAKATVLIEIVGHHLQEEEQDWFPKVRAALTRTQLREIGAELLAARGRAPSAPATPEQVGPGSTAPGGRRMR
ncbi:MAG TPA: hemerythrin domain-containing protein [Kineosporiaceae bacterium]|nr:hemerythrin domain-containing protein [Kineosporiaceae bacterium]